MTFKRIKWFVYFMLAVFLLFFTNDFGLINVEKTAIVAALGIDKADDGFAVTVQIALPDASEQSGAKQKTAVMAEGKTVASAINAIAIKTGWFPKLAFCNLIVLGEEFLSPDYDITGVFSFCKDCSELHDSSYVAICKGKANELLNTFSPLDNLSAFALQKIFFGNVNKYGFIHTTSVKNFLQQYSSLSECSLMPEIIAEERKQEEPSDGQAGEETQMTAASQSGGSQNGGQEKNYIYDATNTLIFQKGIFSGKLDSDQTVCYHVITNKIRDAEMEFLMPEGKYALVTVKSSNCKTNITVTEDKYKVSFDITISCRIADFSERTEKQASQFKFTPSLENAIIKKFYTLTESLVEKSKEINADIFHLKNALYRKYPKKYKSAEKDFIKNAEYKTSIKIKTVNS